MRQSVAVNRVPHVASITSQVNSVAAAKLLEKKKEFEAVSALEKASAIFLQRVEGLGEDCDSMADAGEAHGQVLAQWPNMFRILNMFLTDRVQLSQHPEDPQNYSSGERLVRIPIDELQSTSTRPVANIN